MYPSMYDVKNITALQGRLFGHRLKPSQTKYEYLIETRCSGALVKPYSAVVFEEKVTSSNDNDEETNG